MSTHAADFAPSSADLTTATDSALATLAWSTATGCLNRTGVNAVCYACSPQCECTVCDRDAATLPEFLDGTEADWSNAARATMRDLITSFIGDGSDPRLEAALDGLDYGQIGHDFILTANRHGAGFWDRGRGEAGQYLTEIAHPYGEIGAYLSTSNTLEIGY